MQNSGIHFVQMTRNHCKCLSALSIAERDLQESDGFLPLVGRGHRRINTPGQRNGCWHWMPPGPLGHRSSGGLAVRMRGAGCFNMIWFMSVSVHGFVDTVRVNLGDCTRTEGTLGGNDHPLGISMATMMRAAAVSFPRCVFAASGENPVRCPLKTGSAALHLGSGRYLLELDLQANAQSPIGERAPPCVSSVRFPWCCRCWCRSRTLSSVEDVKRHLRRLQTTGFSVCGERECAQPGGNYRVRGGRLQVWRARAESGAPPHAPRQVAQTSGAPHLHVRLLASPPPWRRLAPAPVACPLA